MVEFMLLDKLLTTEREMLAGAKTYTVDDVECELREIFNKIN